MELGEGFGVIKRVFLPFILDSSRISNKLVGKPPNNFYSKRGGTQSIIKKLNFSFLFFRINGLIRFLSLCQYTTDKFNILNTQLEVPIGFLC